MTRVAINGFGRIGRAVFRIIASRPESDISIVAINDLSDDDILAYLLEYDSVMGRFDQEVTVEDGLMKVGDHEIQMLMERDPTQLPWAALDVDVVIESTGVFRDKASLQKHLDAGAKRVILTVPSKDAIDETIDKDKLRLHMVRKSRDGWAFAPKPLFEMVLHEEARVMLPDRVGPSSSDLFVLEKGAVRCASFR